MGSAACLSDNCIRILLRDNAILCWSKYFELELGENFRFRLKFVFCVKMLGLGKWQNYWAGIKIVGLGDILGFREHCVFGITDLVVGYCMLLLG